MSGSSIAWLIKRAHGLLLDLAEPPLAAHDLTVTQYITLLSLGDAARLNPSDIRAEYRQTGGAMTRVCDHLVVLGLLERDRDNKDRRKVNLRLTQAGRETVERLIPVVVDALAIGIRNFSDDEVDEFSRLLLKYSANLQAGSRQSASSPQST
jgi:DNA-binding MarR family transcriptional regulator